MEMTGSLLFVYLTNLNLNGNEIKVTNSIRGEGNLDH